MKMKKCAIVLVVALMSMVGFSAMLTDAQRDRLNSFVRCQKRDTTTLPGYVISYWTKGGELYRVDTNAVRKITGVTQNNPLYADAEVIRDLRKKAKKAQKNIDKVVKTLKQVLDKAQSEDEAEFYKALLDLILIGEE